MTVISSPVLLPASHRVRLTRRGRRLVTLMLVAPLATGIVVAGGLRVQADVRTTPMGTIVVQPGQSLWQVAEIVAPDQDPRATIRQIEQLNDMNSASVQAGTLLIVPKAP